MKAFLLFVSFLSIFLFSADQALTQSNIPGPTMGGKQIWSDIHALGKWRIQRNVVTGHHRLLDEDNWRQAWGSYEECLMRLRQAETDLGVGFKSPHLVILVHGLGRSAGMFADMQTTLEKAGYQTFAVNYPSTRQSVKDHANDLGQLIRNLEGIDTISFVTHSMGGLVVREYLGQNLPSNQPITFYRLVMIAPPNQGSAIAREFQDFGLYEWLTTDTGQDLAPDKAKQLPIPAIEFGVIAGGRGDGIGFNPILDGDDDGVVTIEEAKLNGMKDFVVVASPHGLIDNHQLTKNAVVSFLEKGDFKYAPQ